MQLQWAFGRWAANSTSSGSSGSAAASSGARPAIDPSALADSTIGYRRAPVALPGDQPVAQTVVNDLLVADVFLSPANRSPRRSAGILPPLGLEVAVGASSNSGRSLTIFPGPDPGGFGHRLAIEQLAAFRLDHRAGSSRSYLAGELEVAHIMSRYGHDRPGAVRRHHHVVGDPDRDASLG